MARLWQFAGREAEGEKTYTCKVMAAPFPRITLALHPGYYKAC